MLFLISAAVFGQYEETANGPFNSFHWQEAPYRKDPTLSENTALIKRYRIKSIVVKHRVEDSRYMDSLVRRDPLKHFSGGHISYVSYFYYTPEGILSAISRVPMNVRLSPEDSATHLFVRTAIDSLKKTRTLSYYNKNQLKGTATYSNGLLIEERGLKEPHNLRYTDTNKVTHDTTWICETYRRCEYDAKGRLIKRVYNTTDYLDLDIKDLCKIEESELYEYKTSETIITKYPFHNKKYTADKYVNRLRLNKQNQVLSSGFYYESDTDPWIIYSCRYDQHQNLTDIYESYDNKNPFEIELQKFRNTYDKDGNLISVEEEQEEKNDGARIFYFNPDGLLIRIGYAGYPSAGTSFEYSFY